MARSSFVETKFTCAICGDVFVALHGPHPAPEEPVCMSCGLKYSPEKRRQLTNDRKQRRGR